MTIRLTLRDFEILQELLTARYLTTPQILSLFWETSGRSGPGPLKACQRRLRQLTRHGLVRRIEQAVKRGEGQKPYIYALGRRGAQILVSELGIDPQFADWRPKNAEANYPFLDHLLATNQLRITLQQACERHGTRLEAWVNEKELKSEGMKDTVTVIGPDGRQRRATVVPDAFFVLQRDSAQGLFFVEVDRGTVTVQPSRWERRGWTRKIRDYLAYFGSAEYRKRYGRPARVLTVTTGSERLAHLKNASEKVGAGDRFWFACLDDLRAETLLTERIWHVCGSQALRGLLE